MLRLAAAALLFSLTACLPATSTSPAAPPAPVLRSYAVPAHGASKMREVLTGLMKTSSGSSTAPVEYLGRVDLGPDDTLLVLAPDGVQRGVEQLLSSMKASSFPAPQTVTVDYWMVTGTPGGQAERAANLGEVAAALAQVEKADGPMDFTLEEHLTLTSLENEHASIDGRELRGSQGIQVVDGQLLGEFDLSRSGQHVRTVMRLAPGAIAVLAAAGMRDDKPATGPARSVYFLVRATNAGGQ